MIGDYNECFSEKQLWNIIKNKIDELYKYKEHKNPISLHQSKEILDKLITLELDIKYLMKIRRDREFDNTLDEFELKQT